MKRHFARPCQAIGMALLACCFLSGLIVAQDDDAATQISNEPAKPMYRVLPARMRADVPLPLASLQSWNGSFTYGGTQYTYNMVGTAPSTDNSTTVPVYIIPIKIVVTSHRTRYTYDPSHVLSNGKTVTNNTIAIAGFRFIHNLHSRRSERGQNAVR